MPICEGCDTRIKSGSLCRHCATDKMWEDEFELEESGREWTECDHCRGRAWVRDGNGGKDDCPVCEGYGKVEVIVDGGVPQRGELLDGYYEHKNKAEQHGVGTPEYNFHMNQAAQYRVGLEEVDG